MRLRIRDRVRILFNTAANRTLGRIPLFMDVVLAIKNLTKTLNDLVRAYTHVAKMILEDREAINDLYQLHAELHDEQLRRLGDSTASPAKPVMQRPVDQSRVNTDWAESDKKKMSN